MERVSKSWRAAGLHGLRKLTCKDARKDPHLLKRKIDLKVEEAYDQNTDSYVVVKRFKGTEACASGAAEARMLRAVRGHSNVQALVTSGERIGRRGKPKYYIVTKDGGDRHGITANPRHSVTTALLGLAHMHRRYVMHGDPGRNNVMFQPDGSATLIDLGCATQGWLACAFANLLGSSYVSSFRGDVETLCGTLSTLLRDAFRTNRDEEIAREVDQLVQALRAFPRTKLFDRWAQGHVPSEEGLRQVMASPRRRSDLSSRDGRRF